MTPNQQRIAIALLLGAHWVHVRQECWLTFDNLERQHGWYKCDKPRKDDEILIASNVPKYLSDLNAMHEAVRILTDGEYAEYSAILARMFGFTRPRYHDATATQRAEAFIKTLNLWKD